MVIVPPVTLTKTPLMDWLCVHCTSLGGEEVKEAEEAKEAWGNSAFHGLKCGEREIIGGQFKGARHNKVKDVTEKRAQNSRATVAATTAKTKAKAARPKGGAASTKCKPKNKDAQPNGGWAATLRKQRSG
jgi:hypothetical protein